ncbi:MAG TPA: MFS transporter [Dokdonella sp.]|nr:MFS transporter [Dokdonella sp.]
MPQLTNPQPDELSRAEHLRLAFIAAWLMCSLFYFAQYALRSAPGVMLDELGQALTLNRVALSTLIGLYYYTYAIFAIITGAALDRAGPKYVVPVGVIAVAVGSVLFGLGDLAAAQVGRLLQGAGSAVAFTGAVYLATRGFPKEWLATAVGMTQCFGMLGGSVGQFAVGPIVHTMMPWQHFWFLSGIILVLLAVGMMLITPARQDYAPTNGPPEPVRRMLAPYKTVLANPQSWLCGLIAGLLFLPTTIFDMIWGVPFLSDGLNVDKASAVARASTVPLGWVVGAPLLGYFADRMGRRKPVILGGAALLALCFAAILYLPPGYFPPYVLGLLMGIGSGAAMIPYTIIKEVNPDQIKGSATGAINCLVFSMTALLNQVFSRFLNARTPPGEAIGLSQYQAGGGLLIAGVVVAMILSVFLRETGARARVVRPPG